MVIWMIFRWVLEVHVARASGGERMASRKNWQGTEDVNFSAKMVAGFQTASQTLINVGI